MTRAEKLERQAKKFSEQLPPGTTVRYWPGSKTDQAKTGVVKCPFSVLGTHTVVGWIDTARGCIAASHIERL